MPDFIKDHSLAIELGALIISLVVFAFILNSGFILQTSADNTTTFVTVENSGPTFASGGDPYEDPSSPDIDGSYSDVGSTQSWRARGTDPNGDNYFLAICKTDSITPVDNGAPTCPGGAWCVASSSTADDGSTEANCSYTLQSTDTNEINAWYAFVCDDVTSGSACSLSSQGSGDSGSPLYINHRPSFSSITDDGGSGVDSGDIPGGSILFQSVASDSDSEGGADSVTLVVCKGNDPGATDAGCNTPSDEMCTASLAADPSCSYTVPTVTPDGNYNYTAYIFDNHGLEATTHLTGQYTVNNSAAVVSNVVVNGGADITLIEDATTATEVTATVTDTNSCNDIVSIDSDLYLGSESSGITTCNQSTDADNNNCYPEVTCSVVTSGNTCDGSSDSSADYVCTVNVQYHAEPTDIDTNYTGDGWWARVNAQDGTSTFSDSESASGVTMLSNLALKVDSEMNYGEVGRGENTPTTVDSNTQPKVSVLATGNVGIDTELAGTENAPGKAMCRTDDYPACSGDGIPATNQQYSPSAFAYVVGTPTAPIYELSPSPVELELNVPKTTTTITPAQQSIFWGIEIPLDIAAGQYTGQNTVVAVKSEVAEW